MAPFDRRLLEKRANRSLKKNPNSAKAKKKYFAQMSAINGMSKVVKWCETRELKVEFEPVISTLSLQDKMITLNSRVHIETQFHQLLHECGHFIICKDFAKVERKSRWSSIEKERSRYSMISKVEIIDEELEAWRQGLNLAKMLNIEVNIESFEKHKADAITTYMKWALDC